MFFSSGLSPFLDDSDEETTNNILRCDFSFPEEHFPVGGWYFNFLLLLKFSAEVPVFFLFLQLHTKARPSERIFCFPHLMFFSLLVKCFKLQNYSLVIMKRFLFLTIPCAQDCYLQIRTFSLYVNLILNSLLAFDNSLGNNCLAKLTETLFLFCWLLKEVTASLLVDFIELASNLGEKVKIWWRTWQVPFLSLFPPPPSGLPSPSGVIPGFFLTDRFRRSHVYSLSYFKVKKCLQLVLIKKNSCDSRRSWSSYICVA